MIWTLTVLDEAAQGAVDDSAWRGRYVVHRHRDAAGPHVDLRLEERGWLGGYRIEADGLAGEMLATAKAPHGVAWLEQDGDAVREDAGRYAWAECGGGLGELVLESASGMVRRIAVEPAAGLPLDTVRAVADALTARGLPGTAAVDLVRDGLAARERAVARFCGLSRELDGSAFDETVWRKSLSGLSLDEIHGHLRGLEVRFDAKYPPQPVSRPERLTEAEAPARRASAWAIAQQGV